VNKRLIVLKLGVAGLLIFLAAAAGRELAFRQPLPRPPEPQPAPTAAIATVGANIPQAREGSLAKPDSSEPGDSSADDVAVSRNLFDPSWSAGSATAEPPGGRPLLYGVVTGAGVGSRAYVEDPVTKRVRGYQIGDRVAGWRLDQIREDRVVIAGPGPERLEVRLRNPAKPTPAVVASAEVAVIVDSSGAGSPGVVGQPSAPLPSPAPAVSAPERIRAAVPRGIGVIPSQLFRPASARPAPPEPMAQGED
jgi:hypothetical protein